MKTPPERQLKHAGFVRGAERAGKTVATAVETDEFKGVTELTVLSPDHPRLLADRHGRLRGRGR
jgi:[protein-PII] uridylyltransferase